MSFPRIASCAVVALLSFGSVALAADLKPLARPKVGDQAPAFSLQDLTGGRVSLEQGRKRGPVVLIVLRGWPGYQCPLCTKQVGDFVGKAKQFQEAGATVVMVYPGPAADLDEHAKEFVQGQEFPGNFRLALDPGYELVDRYGLRWDAPKETAYPSTFVIDADGKILFAKISDDHGGRSSAAQVLKALPKE
ncbi:MAG TPA: peroxiredoxin family protein [Pirellulaceae bacterium]|jgi:peroxiredoxin|nr:peroxiredoxin family protein [Pirellulaceae bacterium]